MHDVRAIVEDLNDPDRAIWSPVLADLNLTQIETGGVEFYPIAKDQFAPYASLGGAQLEQRAVALRMDTVLAACAEFIAQGRSVRELSEYALSRAGLLPRDWIVPEHAPLFRDWFVLAAAGDRVGIAMRGSYAALEPLGDRYRNRAARIQYPYPREWSPGKRYAAKRVNRLMMFEFTPKALEAAAAELASAPPRELSERFWPEAK
jgi:hypothetical protein